MMIEVSAAWDTIETMIVDPNRVKWLSGGFALALAFLVLILFDICNRQLHCYRSGVIHRVHLN